MKSKDNRENEIYYQKMKIDELRLEIEQMKKDAVEEPDPWRKSEKMEVILTKYGEKVIRYRSIVKLLESMNSKMTWKDLFWKPRKENIPSSETTTKG